MPGSNSTQQVGRKPMLEPSLDTARAESLSCRCTWLTRCCVAMQVERQPTQSNIKEFKRTASDPSAENQSTVTLVSASPGFSVVLRVILGSGSHDSKGQKLLSEKPLAHPDPDTVFFYRKVEGWLFSFL